MYARLISFTKLMHQLESFLSLTVQHKPTNTGKCPEGSAKDQDWLDVNQAKQITSKSPVSLLAWGHLIYCTLKIPAEMIMQLMEFVSLSFIDHILLYR